MPVGDRVKLEGPHIRVMFGQPAVDMELVQETTPAVVVNEGDFDVPTGMEVRPLDRVTISAHGNIWAGVWLTGNNGPRGWNNTDGNPKFPLPGSHPFALLGRLNGRYFYIGDGVEFFHRGQSSRLALRTNDDNPGNGSGAFHVTVQVWRRV